MEKKSIADKLIVKRGKSCISSLVIPSDLSFLQKPRTYNKRCETEGESSGKQYEIHVAECANCSLLYVDQNRYKLNVKFNDHRSGIKCYPSKCEILRYFLDHGCDCNKDFEVSVLKEVPRGEELWVYQKDKWITWLRTLQPTGMNSLVSDLRKAYKALFDINKVNNFYQT